MNIHQEIEDMAKKCCVCQENGVSLRQVFPAWPDAEQPWEEIPFDFAVDSYSKFPFIRPVSAANTTSTIAALQSIFAIAGLPRTIVNDNGTRFTSMEFNRFCEANAEHLTTAPFHPA
uniref:Integrase catalytic domain-containing protein n=1 Tax=Musca domestica TaxID=7370 RepID=A0A1I8MGF3_MUSDO